jgi:hypothetical protein
MARRTNTRSTAPTTWETYEEVARYLLAQMASHFGLGRVEGKQVLLGKSGTEWEIDAKGISIDRKGFVVIECRRQPKSRIKQSAMAALAYEIKDVGASGGITVSPLNPQTGAKRIAAQDNIQHVRLTPESTTTNYILQFLTRAFAGIGVEAQQNTSVAIKVIRADGSK